MSNISSLSFPIRFGVVAIVLAGTLSACGTSGEAINDSTSTPITTSTPLTTDSPTEQTIDPWTTPGENMRGLRYCEILFLNMSENGLVAEVYNTYPLNQCPVDTWQALDTAAIAQAEGVPLAIANGPRFWLMDSIGRSDRSDIVTREFGGIEMNRYAQVVVGTPDSVGLPYSPQSVDRRSSFSFNAGQTVYTLIAVDGTEYIMQSWSQQRDASLTEDTLADLGTRLDLPNGWRFIVRILSEDLVVDTTETLAQVLQDELMNSYSLLA